MKENGHPDFLIIYLQNFTASCSKTCTQILLHVVLLNFRFHAGKNDIQIFICEINRSSYFMWEHHNLEIQQLL